MGSIEWDPLAVGMGACYGGTADQPADQQASAVVRIPSFLSAAEVAERGRVRQAVQHLRTNTNILLLW